MQVARRPRLAVSHLVLPGISLCALAACGKPDDAKSVDLIRKVTVHQKLVHVPNEHVRRMLAEHGGGSPDERTADTSAEETAAAGTDR